MASFADLIAAADRVAIRAFGDAEDGEPAPATYTPSGGVGVPVTGIFDENYVLAQGGGESAVSVTSPALFVRLEDLPEDPRAASSDPTVTVRGVDYEVTECVTDGIGGAAVLVLRRRTP